MRERPRGARVAPRAPDRIRDARVGRSPLAWKFAKSTSRGSPTSPVLAQGVGVSPYGSVSCSSRADSVKAQWDPRGRPAGSHRREGESYRRGAARRGPREGRYFCRASLRTEPSGCASERVRRHANRHRHSLSKPSEPWPGTCPRGRRSASCRPRNQLWWCSPRSSSAQRRGAES
jgi:hypothetical protein